MAALTANSGSRERAKFGKIYSFPVAAGVHIYRGAIVAVSEGYAQPAKDEVDDASHLLVVGIAWEEADNSDGGDGDKDVRVHDGLRYRIDYAGADQTVVGKLATVVDDATVSKYQGAGHSNIVVGRITELIDATSVYVNMEDRPSRTCSSAND